MSLLGIDVGTTGCKAIAFGRDGGVLARAYREYPLIVSRLGWAELDAEQIWRSVASSACEVAAQVSHDPPWGLTVSALGEAVVPVASDGSVLGNCIVSFDSRAGAQFEQFTKRVGENTIYDITGLHPLPHYSIFKLMWWRDNDPQLYDHTWKFLCVGDYIGFKLGLKPTIDYSMATRTLAFDVHEAQWSQPLINAAGLEVEKLPSIAPSGTVIGEISRAVAADLNLPTGVIVVLGGLDQACAALGAGIIHPGDALLSLGTVGVIGAVLDAPTPQMRTEGISAMPHVVPNTQITLGAALGGGSVLRWYRDELGQEEQTIAQETGRDVFTIIIEQMDDQPTDLLVLPHLAGSRFAFNDPDATGVIVGLTFGATRQALIRALLEGVAYELAFIRDRFLAAGVPIQALHAVGGGSRADAWMQIMADCIQIPIHRMEVSEAASLGAAILCGYALGIYDTLQAAAAVAVSTNQTFEPRPDWARYHTERLMAYREVYTALRNLPDLQQRGTLEIWNDPKK